MENAAPAIAMLALLAVIVWFAGRCLVDLARTPEEDLRHFPKVAWALLIVATCPIGPALYLVYGKGSRRPA